MPSVASAELGAAKPERAIFEHALALAGVGAERAWHVGDDLRDDVEGARAAGIRAVLLARGGSPARRAVRRRPASRSCGAWTNCPPSSRAPTPSLYGPDVELPASLPGPSRAGAGSP